MNLGPKAPYIACTVQRSIIAISRGLPSAPTDVVITTVAQDQRFSLVI